MSTATTQTDNDAILLRRDEDGVTTLTLNRPGQYNALSEEMLAALQAQMDAIAEDDSVRCVVIAAEGRAFCAGHDLKQMCDNRRRDYYDELFDSCGKLMQSITELPVPVIAKVQGIATAAGCQLVATCDLAVSVDSARFAVSGINVGLFCSTPAVALSRNLSRKRAFEMLVTGDFIDAEKAIDWGLINRAVPAEELDTAVKQLTDSICAKSPVAVRTGKGMFYQQLEQGVAGAYALAADRMACNMMAEDAGEGLNAFIAKRKPEWKGR